MIFKKYKRPYSRARSHEEYFDFGLQIMYTWIRHLYIYTRTRAKYYRPGHSRSLLMLVKLWATLFIIWPYNWSLFASVNLHNLKINENPMKSFKRFQQYCYKCQIRNEVFWRRWFVRNSCSSCSTVFIYHPT